MFVYTMLQANVIQAFTHCWIAASERKFCDSLQTVVTRAQETGNETYKLTVNLLYNANIITNKRE